MPGPRCRRALARLREKFRIAPLSNGNIALQADLARRNNFRWDAIVGADLSRDYKPKPRLYLDAAEASGLMPQECMMVACHSADLAAAKNLGLRTAHIARAGRARARQRRARAKRRSRSRGIQFGNFGGEVGCLSRFHSPEAPPLRVMRGTIFIVPAPLGDDDLPQIVRRTYAAPAMYAAYGGLIY